MDFKYEEHRIYSVDDDGRIIAQISFPMVEDGVVNIDSTYVSSSLRGQGIAGKLMDDAIDIIEKNNWKTYLDCSYARVWADKHPEKSHLYL
ncbi:MAG: GNAT family N-acetyltransferase [Peptostreptococcus sp.]|uniref:GNAT family N-acetyltransferase n=1 Tax=Peptostreptococcus sp. TaxID=1262 RepID=UPI002FC91D34